MCYLVRRYWGISGCLSVVDFLFNPSAVIKYFTCHLSLLVFCLLIIKGMLVVNVSTFQFFASCNLKLCLELYRHL